MGARRPLLLIGAGAAVAVAAARVLGRRRASPAPIVRMDAEHAVGLRTRTARTAELARLGTKVGTAVAAHRAQRVFASPEKKASLDAQLELKTAAQVAEALGSMKGAMMKLGQMASYLDEGMPEPFRDALAQLQQDAPPMSADLAASVVEAELGLPPEKAFAAWESQPMAAASIGQVHRATTHDGVDVAVKVQYPGVDEAIKADLDNTGLLFQVVSMVFPGLDPGPLVAELRERLEEELDYRKEAANQQLFAEYYRGHPFIHIPDVVESLSSARVLTTELASGARFDEVVGWSQGERDLAAEAIYRFVFRSLYRLHAFNGDPHPGNYLFRPGGQVTFLDFGLVKRFTPEELGMFESMIQAMVLEPSPQAFRAAVEKVGLLRPGAPVTIDQVADYFGHFYDFVRTDEVRTLTGEYASATVRQTFDASHPVTKYATVPPPFVIIQRINLGLYAILGRLRATANWRRIAEELWPMVDGPPSTALGETEAAWLATRRCP